MAPHQFSRRRDAARSDDGAQTSGKCVGRCPEVSTNNNNNEQLGREYAEKPNHPTFVERGGQYLKDESGGLQPGPGGTADTA